jgi:hypothetical protein
LHELIKRLYIDSSGKWVMFCGGFSVLFMVMKSVR